MGEETTGAGMTTHWQDMLRRVYGREVALTPLDGEYDLNFLGSGPDRDIIVKVMHAGCPIDLADLQCQALAQVQAVDPGLPLQTVVPALDGRAVVTAADPDGVERIVWVIGALPGLTMGRCGPQPAEVLSELGELAGKLDLALKGFTHPGLARATKWNLTTGDWIAAQLDCLTGDRRDLIRDIVNEFATLKPALADLSAQAIHNDLNDYNILIAPDLSGGTAITGLIDLGDMVVAPRVCEIAIAAAYAIMGQAAPERALASLVAGYHSAAPLSGAEIDLIWPLLRMRLAVSVVNSTREATARPDDPYVTISQAPAWAILENPTLDTDLIRARLRATCELPVVAEASAILRWLKAERGGFAAVLGEDLSDAPTGALSVAASATPRNPFDLGATEAARIGDDLGHENATWIGFYGEPRLIYTAPAFRRGNHLSSDRRTVHLGVDLFAPAGRVVHAPCAGRVIAVENRAAHLDYGGMVILGHETPTGEAFYTLYGHLDPAVCDRLTVGDDIAKGAAFAALGVPAGNGGWAPHLHFQLALGIAGIGDDWPGAADPDDFALWRALCPNPATLLNLPDNKVAHVPIDEAALLRDRHAAFAGNLRLSYRRPLTLLRGWRHHLFDQMGRPYLDAYNNVPHVGHAHPRIQTVAADQLMRMNANTRYLHPAQTTSAETLTAKMPNGLEVVFLVNSGSEANELALRLARSWSGGRDMITPDHGYHGNTTGTIAISAYKFMKPGGGGQEPWVHLVDVADDYRGQFRRNDANRDKIRGAGRCAAGGNRGARRAAGRVHRRDISQCRRPDHSAAGVFAGGLRQGPRRRGTVHRGRSSDRPGSAGRVLLWV